MSAEAPRLHTYRTTGADEPILSRGPADGPQLLIVQPLFEEMNRCRSILADVQRGLAAAGVGSHLIDLPGTGESSRPLDLMSLADWRQAIADAAATIPAGCHALSLRGGALVDDAAPFRSRWRLSPVSGGRVLRELDRAGRLAGRDDGLRAGYPLSPAFAEELGAASLATGAPLRTVRLGTDPDTADARIVAAPPWRRSEPARDPALAAAIVGDVCDWLARCGA